MFVLFFVYVVFDVLVVLFLCVCLYVCFELSSVSLMFGAVRYLYSFVCCSSLLFFSCRCCSSIVVFCVVLCFCSSHKFVGGLRWFVDLRCASS